jgi:hypothetical protein
MEQMDRANAERLAQEVCISLRHRGKRQCGAWLGLEGVMGMRVGRWPPLKQPLAHNGVPSGHDEEGAGSPRETTSPTSKHKAYLLGPCVTILPFQAQLDQERAQMQRDRLVWERQQDALEDERRRMTEEAEVLRYM